MPGSAARAAADRVLSRRSRSAFPGAPIVVSINDPNALAEEPRQKPYPRRADDGRARRRPTCSRARSAPAKRALPAADDDRGQRADDGERRCVRCTRSPSPDRPMPPRCSPARKRPGRTPRGQPRSGAARRGILRCCNTFWSETEMPSTWAKVFRHGGQFLKFPRRFIAASASER